MDAAQRWETEALRESRARRGGRPSVSQDRRRPAGSPAVWVTLREASDATGIPAGTLGSWARRGTIDSYLETNGGRKLRIVDLNGVRGRAIELGRPIAPQPAEQPPSPPSEVIPPTGGETDRTETMIVPIDAWNKMLLQLGNLHEAGQQLAEARERAAKAETEAEFLRERLAETRATSSSPPAAEQGETEPWMPDAPPEPPTRPIPVTPTLPLWRSLYAGWKSWRR